MNGPTPRPVASSRSEQSGGETDENEQTSEDERARNREGEQGDTDHVVIDIGGRSRAVSEVEISGGRTEQQDEDSEDR